MNVTREIQNKLIGEVKESRSNIIPFGYLKCEHQLVSKIQYARLYEVIQDSFALFSDDLEGENFRLPPSGDSLIIGADTSLHPLGLIGGENTVQLTVDTMPNHTHVANPHSHGTISASGHEYGSNQTFERHQQAGTTSSTTVVINHTGDNVPHENMMPSMYCSRIIKF